MMEKFLFSRAAWIGLVFLLAGGCEKKAETAQGELPTGDQAKPSIEIQAGSGAGSPQPATIGHEQNSFASFIHFPKDPSAAQEESAVQFYCDVSGEGTVDTTYALVGDRAEFKQAVQSALDWGHFTPATVDGKPVSAYVGGTVLFMHQDGQPVIVLSLATADRARVGKLANYIQPQLIGSLRTQLEQTGRKELTDLPISGGAEVLVNINEHGDVTSTSIVSESPKDIGLGEFLNSAVKTAHFTPAYEDGKPAAGQINVVANFGEL